MDGGRRETCTHPRAHSSLVSSTSIFYLTTCVTSWLEFPLMILARVCDMAKRQLKINWGKFCCYCCCLFKQLNHPRSSQVTIPEQCFQEKQFSCTCEFLHQNNHMHFYNKSRTFNEQKHFFKNRKFNEKQVLSY